MNALEQRLFLALWPTPSIQEALARIRNGLSKVRGTAVHQEDLHLTLVFLGKTREARRTCVEQTLDGVHAHAFDLVIDQVGYWSRAAVVWCAPHQLPHDLEQLVRSLQEQTQGCGFTLPDRTYAAHITLLRHASAPSNQPLIPPLTWRVQDFALVASTLGGPPPRYRVLRRWSLL